MKDPYGLFNEPAPAPIPPARPDSTSSPLSQVAVGVIIAIACLMLWQKYQGSDEQKKEEQHHEQRLSGEERIYLIHEKKPQSPEHTLLLREMPAWAEQHKLRWVSLDDDLTDPPVPELIAFAKEKGVLPPFALLAGKKPIKVIPWPNDLGALDKLIK